MKESKGETLNMINNATVCVCVCVCESIIKIEANVNTAALANNVI